FVKYFEGPVESFIQYLSTMSHLENLGIGLITIGDLVYYLSGIVIFLVLTRLSIENRLRS
ncbi:MAG: ABC transporter, partial [Candidatus Omnitrophica bacterium]|nr:ABC transporter [Candidatus Omnitrophota bacterium]